MYWPYVIWAFILVALLLPIVNMPGKVLKTPIDDRE